MRKSLSASLLLTLISTVAGAQTVYQGAIKLIGTVTYPRSAGAGAIPQSANDEHIGIPHPNLQAALAAKVGGVSALAALTNPDPAPKTVVRPEAGFFGYGALTHLDSRLASDGNQFNLEPPDQGLAVGNGFVFEVVNAAVAIYDKHSVLQAPIVSLNAFFGQPPALLRSTPLVYGPRIGDPRVYYDQQIQRWFLTSVEEDSDPSTGNLTGQTHLMLAVNQTSNPAGSYFVYQIDTTNDGSNGTPTDPGCPCFPDQPPAPLRPKPASKSHTGWRH